jgi:hypothetical protein
MEQRDANLIIGTSGGTAGKGSKTYKLSIPSSWVRQLALTEDNRSVRLIFDGEQILIQPQKKESEGHRILKMIYYDKEQPCSYILADYTAETVQVDNFCENPVKTAFGQNLRPSWEQYQEFLASRCVPRERAGLREYLEAIGVDEYNPLTIIRKTNGRMSEDHQWIRIEEDIV